MKWKISRTASYATKWYVSGLPVIMGIYFAERLYVGVGRREPLVHDVHDR